VSWRRIVAALRGERPASDPSAPPPPGEVDLGSLRRLEPISRHYGFDRGSPVDRHYIESFLEGSRGDIRGRVLEIGDDAYTRRFGGAAVERADVLHVDPEHPGASYGGDLAEGAGLPDETFDCVVLTQTLQLVWDLRGAIATLHRALVPGGVVLATVPGITQLSADEWKELWCWSFTPLSARRLFAERFGDDGVEVEAHGNVLASIAFLEGMATHELEPAELAHRDPLYPLLITVRARKAGGGEATSPR